MEMDFAKQVGMKLEKLRLKYGLTQEQIATVLGIDRSAYAYYEGGRSLPPPKRLITLARIYSVSVDYLLDCDSGINIKEKAAIIAPLASDETTLPIYHKLLSVADRKKKHLKVRHLA